MKPEAQRIALAKLDGWTCISSTYLTGLPPHRNVDKYSTEDILSNNVPIEELPDYLNDLNSLHALEKKLDGRAKREFVLHLNEGYSVHCIDNSEAFDLVNASALRRAECILKATNLWTDDER